MRSKRHAIEILAENLRALMKHHEYTMTSLAAKAGVDKNTIRNILRHANAPQLDKLESIAKVFRLDVWQLLIDGAAQSLLSNGHLSDLVGAYVRADDSGRTGLLKVAEVVTKPYRA